MSIKPLLALAVLVFGLNATVASAQDLSSVDINRASAQELADVLTGIGLTRAQAIVEYRSEFGPFEDVYELVNVRGVGERTVELNEDKLRLK